MSGTRFFYGLCFSPYVDKQDPNTGINISEEQIRERIGIIAPHTIWIRTYGCDNGLERIGGIGHEYGLKTAIGCWIGKDNQSNERQIGNLITLGRFGEADILVVGNEALLRRDVSPDQLLSYITLVKDAVPGVPVTTADTIEEYQKYPALIDAVDVIFVNVYPYWDGIAIEAADTYTKQRYSVIAELAQNKTVYLSEIGWPDKGKRNRDAIPSEEYARRYLTEMTIWAQANNIPYFYFEAFDESWKQDYEGEVGAHWGIWDAGGKMKYPDLINISSSV
jgi:exo-beta-1,3-glucanase (GH17 family)